MNNNEWNKWVGVVGRLLLAFVFVFSQIAWAEQGQQTKEKASTPQNATAQQAVEKQAPAAATAKPQTAEAQGETSEKSIAAEKPSADGSHEGIKVHGHWAIEVRNPDGTVVTHREFENSLAPNTNFLSGVLTRAATAGAYEITLSGQGAGAIYIDEPGSPGAYTCANLTGASLALTSCSNKLTVTMANTALTLAGFGTVPPSFGASVTSVSTQNFVCISTVTPGGCATGGIANVVGGAAFTTRLLDGVNGDPQPVPVSPGQTVSVTVTISFS